jgi:hypothetical protein
MCDLQSLLDQCAQEVFSAIESTDDQFAAALTQHDRAMAKHRENAQRYATPQQHIPQIASISVKHGDRAYSCTNAEVIAAAKQKRPIHPICCISGCDRSSGFTSCLIKSNTRCIDNEKQN